MPQNVHYRSLHLVGNTSDGEAQVDQRTKPSPRLAPLPPSPDQAEVDFGLKRLVAHLASRAAGCQYCMAHTIGGALRQSDYETKVAAIRRARYSVKRSVGTTQWRL